MSAAEFLGESFLVISGNALTDIDLDAVLEHRESHDGFATLATKRVQNTAGSASRSPAPTLASRGFQEKPKLAEVLSDLANCGTYVFRAEIVGAEGLCQRAARAGRWR